MYLLWLDSISHNDVLLFFYDAAPYMVKIAKNLIVLNYKMVHVTRLAHTYHRVIEKTRG